ncbi:Mycobacterial persistence regulator A [Slackia heliotrinireducens]|uniref:Response regulator with CheY-like receiver domain and winged-helix DNA-binding domain n=1 Tax=Slackia heliotrinireducens (strain ATCC 29202 / DSM 20476 / NCTC 11029 / RHS 1) TaxID=471855 RepID=C7N662_SLAHD|nr:response regulator transcription factor [Slackia heliotrinireducens]ACV22397.1 response regulator with CheY-like receiver domain and winged-helix DNA-binding domain [Slackia heliotrinireducens DSM 20476]VEH00709.1 Mycobacterial persistence regulator A [Slackia heliotrinireducens]
MRVLIVEDDPNIAEYLRKSLESEGFTTDVAYDGPTGFDMALANPYDAITLDIILPGKNGYTVCKELRDSGVTTPILMLTAKDGEYDEADAFDTGADDFLRKPFSLVVLLARLRALVRRGGVAKGSVLKASDLMLDTRTKRVTRAGREIELTPREFALLELLLMNAGNALPKQLLLERVWGYAILADENVVEVYISYLRRKVDAPFDKKLIRTVRGVGYCIDKDPE